MSRRPVSLLTAAVLAVSALLMAAGPALAQRGGHGSRGSFHGGGFRGFHGGGFGDGFRGGFRGDFFRGDFRRRFRDGFFRGGFYPGFYGYGLGRGFYGYGPSYPYGSPGFLANSTGYPASVVSGYYSPPQAAGASAAGPADYGTAPADNSAHIRVEVPANAEVWVEGYKTSQTGPVRDFISPPLDPKKKCFYTIRARWTEEGRAVEQTREVNVRANAWAKVDFTRPATGTETLPAPRDR
jgi:uncharacterized protein (TIGR03000 family)